MPRHATPRFTCVMATITSFFKRVCVRESSSAKCAHKGDSDSDDEIKELEHQGQDDEIKELEHQGQDDEIPPAHNSVSASASEPGSDGPDQDDRGTSKVKRRRPRDCRQAQH